ncbi:MAG: polymer-forming cytoskeletal protein [Rhodospirillales bacterium]|nr:polymer-forming cytoskeletal protein [Rhodospirillales bacterium]
MSTQDQENQNRSIDIPSSGSAFPQRPAQQGQAPRMPGSSYASSYSAASSSAGGTAEDRKLVIGRGITLSGEIDSCDVLIVEGTVEAALKGAETLEITESGVFYGSVEIENATIAGRFEGDITATGRLTITATGSITGTISYKEMAMEAGAIIDGRMSPLDAQQSQGSARKDRKLTKASAAKNAGDDSELPLSDTAVAAE